MRKTALLFSGSGAQYPGMMKDICDEHPVAADIFSAAGEVLKRDIADITFNSTPEQLGLTENTQPAIFCAEIAAFAVFKEYGVPFDSVAGFSSGEWAALTAAGVVSFKDAIALVQLRATAMQKAVPVGQGGMAVILGKDSAFVDAFCRQAEGYIVPSNYNCPGQITVSGEAKALESLLKAAGEQGVVMKRLDNISIPSHCKLMLPAAEQLDAALQEVSLSDAAVPIVMNCTASPTVKADEIRRLAVKQLTEPVRFEQSIRALIGTGTDTFIEIGPGKTLTGLVKKTAKSMGAPVTTLRIENTDTLRQTMVALEG